MGRRRAGEFDAFLFADYSGAAAPSAQRRAIALWRLDRGKRPRKVEGPLTRESVREALRSLVEGGDGRPPLGPAHVFPAAFNAWAGTAVFHCRVKGLARRYGLPTRAEWAGNPVRLAERAMPGAKPATRLGGTGAVAGQTLVGLFELHHLLEDARRLGIPVLAWPMDALADDGRSRVGCEIYPSFCRPAWVPKTDDADARWTCLWASRADLANVLDLTRAPAAVREAARLEGWVLGATADDPRRGDVMEKKPEELKVFISHRASVCGECREELGPKAWVFLAGERGALCLSCADLDHLVFLPSGDAAVTRRARRLSTLAAVVLKWSRARNRYERQGLLVEEDALHQAEEACLADEEARARRRERSALRHAETGRGVVARFAARVRELFLGRPEGRETAIAGHACEKYSGRVGRSAAARSLVDEAVRLAVVAHVRHPARDAVRRAAGGWRGPAARPRSRPARGGGRPRALEPSPPLTPGPLRS